MQVGGKKYITFNYTRTTNMKGNQVKYYPSVSILYFDELFRYYDIDSKKAYSKDRYSAYEFKTSYMKKLSEDSETDSSKLAAINNLTPSTVNVLANTKKNRKKSFK